MAVIASLFCGQVLPAQGRHEFVAVHMGVPVRIVLYARDSAIARDAARAAYDRISRLDNIMSDYRPESEVRQLSRRPREWVDVSRELAEVLQRALDIARISTGAFDPTVGPLVALWRDARRTRQLPAVDALRRARARVGWQHLAVDTLQRRVRLAVDSMQLDLGGIAKGYIIQAAMEVLRGQGITSAMIDAGGDIVVGDAPPGELGWHVEVTDVNDDFQTQARILTNSAIATSGASEQFVEIDGVRYSHVVDPRTGLGLVNSYTVTVIATDGATADAVATAAGVLGPRAAEGMRRNLPGVQISFHVNADAPR